VTVAAVATVEARLALDARSFAAFDPA